MKRSITGRMLAAALCIFFVAGCDHINTEPTIKPSPKATPTASAALPSPSLSPTIEPTLTPSPAPTQTPIPTPKPTPEPTPSPSPTKKPSGAATVPTSDILKGKIIGIDPGHQARANTQLEPVAPESSKVKKKVSSGTQGRYTRVPEYQVALNVGLLLKQMLEANGATVVMTRETHNVDISNKERAEFFNRHNTDYALRLHCNGSSDLSRNGAYVLIPSSNPFIEECREAADYLIENYAKATGMAKHKTVARSDQAGFNWCERMIINIEMGYMTYEADDRRLADPEFQVLMAKGLCGGIIEYFKNNP